MAHFQIRLSGAWENFTAKEDQLLKEVFSAGYPKLWATVRCDLYEFDFVTMEQKNTRTRKVRSIRPPYRAKPASNPSVLPAVLVVEVPSGTAGSLIHVSHPSENGREIPVWVPPEACAGQRMMVHVTAQEDEFATPNPLEEVWELARNDVPFEPTAGRVRLAAVSSSTVRAI